MWTNESIINPDIHKAFVYEIENLITGELYIGKKNTFTRRRNPKTNRYEYKESDWRTYQSSSNIVKAWTKIEKRIIQPCKTPAEANYIEISLLFKLDALDDDSLYVNRNIAGRYYNYYPYKGTKQ